MRRDYAITRSYRNTFLLELAIGVIEILVYFYISRTFTQVNTAKLNGAPTYFDFAVVGIIVTVVIAATSTELATRVRQEQLAGTLEALFLQPLTTMEVALGLVAVPFIFAMVRAVVYLTIAAAFLGLVVTHADWLGAGLMLIVTGAAMCAFGIAAGAFVLVVRRGGAYLSGMLLFAMGFISGAVFPASVLPGWVQPIGAIVPTRFAYDGLRSTLFQGSDWGGDALALALFATIGVAVAICLFAGALVWTKRRASLAQY
jgi:ABC-2 type transport system permease protein